MILYHYIKIGELGRVISIGKQGVPCVKLRLKHRSNVYDGPYNLFGQSILPKCVYGIERELGVEEKDSLIPLFKDRAFMEFVYRSNKTFNDRNTGLSQFVISFYEDIDSFDLWLRYGGGGDGVSVGLDADKIKLPFGQIFNYLVRKCIYWPKEVVDSLSAIEVPQAVYDEIKEMYQSTTNKKVVEAFNKLYSNDTPEFAVSQRIKETLVHNMISAFDLFHKCDDWKGEKEHRMTLSVMSHEICYEKNASGDYDPFVDVEIPIDSLKMIMIGPKCGKNAYGMVQSLLFNRQIKEKVQVLNSNCLI